MDGVKFDVLTLFPEMFEGFLTTSMIRIGLEKGRMDVGLHNIRDHAKNKHRRVDESPYGGGPGMVMTPQPIDDTLKTVATEGAHVVYLSPKGRRLDQQKVMDLAEKDHLVLLCGHYEGVDQRILDKWVDEEISIGDYILTGGELAAMVVIDATSRLLEGVLGKGDSFLDESFMDGLLEHPHYTRPRAYEGREVPAVLLSGDHGAIEDWRLERAIEETIDKRPDLIDVYLTDPKRPEKIKGLIRKRLNSR